ncbi:MAG TPA: DUF1385 domain-containing protein [Lachnospiraceae bacterium]|nr:DUF1385 domain-containing protein [Lachnospiraceae bacterium]
MKYSSIGGQAVMEGVMMRNAEKWAVAVRTADHQITVKTGVYNGVIPWKGVNKIPILRGVCSFIDSLYLGMKTLMFSADLFAEESEKELEERLKDEEKKARKKAEKLRQAGKEEQAQELIEKTLKNAETERSKLKEREASGNGKSSDSDNKALLTVTLIFSLAVSIALFMMLPYFLSRALRMVTSSESLISVCEAILRMAIFFGYLLLISRMKDIQRTFMYHGAEHKCINCIEHGMELNVENVRKSSRQHKRCGTSFLLIVMIVSVIFFFFIRTSNPALRIVIRILLIPVIAGVSFEFIRLAGRSNNKCVNILSKPGLLLQKLTTREPDDDQIRVGMASVEAVFNWKQYLNENFGAHYELTQADEPRPGDDLYTIK